MKKNTTIKMDDETRRLALREAHRRGLSLSEYIREATRDRVLRDADACKACGRPHGRVRTAA